MIFDRDELWIRQVTGLQPVACACHKCSALCKRAPCLATPAEILHLINCGHSYRIQPVRFCRGTKYDLDLTPIAMYGLRMDTGKPGCTFLNNGLCDLHYTGLKPIEGRLAHCQLTETPAGKLPLDLAVALTWTFPHNDKTIILIQRALASRKDFQETLAELV
jgi:hypothetical protein